MTINTYKFLVDFHDIHEVLATSLQQAYEIMKEYDGHEEYSLYSIKCGKNRVISYA